MKADKLFHDGGPYHIETSLLICRANKKDTPKKEITTNVCK